MGVKNNNSATHTRIPPILLSLFSLMSSLHWEARRRQNVADKRTALAESKRDALTLGEADQCIQNIANEMCQDAALPTHFLLNKSKAALSKANDDKCDAIEAGQAVAASAEPVELKNR